jgi:hypothetical protein
MAQPSHPELPPVSIECEQGRHDDCPRIVVRAEREIDEIGCSCDCHLLRYDTSGGGESDSWPDDLPDDDWPGDDGDRAPTI